MKKNTKATYRARKGTTTKDAKTPGTRCEHTVKRKWIKAKVNRNILYIYKK